ncbi:extensin [Iris pallida]|uniref:Extensin n=1 Tax=Iris pallida TaxID=29817 RepID=A0AAX6DII6_IRIPA|nr:extensin [Iris pallida]KAJ6801324.1 extensin [Iris pallida]
MRVTGVGAVTDRGGEETEMVAGVGHACTVCVGIGAGGRGVS